MDEMDDDAFLSAFAEMRLPRIAWTHAAHVRMGFLVLERRPPAEGLDWVRAHIRAYNESLGNFTGYHETITVAFFALIADARTRTPGLDWRAFAAAHPELFTPKVLETHYDPQTLRGADARAGFVAPDRAPLPRVGLPETA